jgi:hypothetical protein
LNEIAKARGDDGAAAAAAQENVAYLRWRIFARMRRFFRPTLRRPLLFLMGLTDLS